MTDATKYTSKLHNARILIIGGSSGIGFCVAEACLESGAANVAIASSNRDRLGRAVASLKASYPSASHKVFGAPVDLSNADTLEGELKTLLEATAEGMGGAKLDHVVFTAGDALAVGGLEDMTMRKILAAGQIRFFAPLLLAKYLPSYLTPSYRSSYTITTGGVSEKPMRNWSVVGAYAGGLHSMVRNLALDLKPIRVNGVSPGAVDTELWKVEGEEKERMMESVAAGMATGRVGRPEDVAECYLACLRDGNMDGSMVRTDGGHMVM